MCKIIDMFSREIVPEVTVADNKKYNKIITKYQEDAERKLSETLALTKTETELKNDYCIINLDSDSIDGRDLTDHYNEPAFYTKNKRSIKKGWKDLSESFNGETTMHDAITILDKYNLRCHSYCMMD